MVPNTHNNNPLKTNIIYYLLKEKKTKTKATKICVNTLTHQSGEVKCGNYYVFFSPSRHWTASLRGNVFIRQK